MKNLKRCEICNHGYFEGEGCRGCYYSEFFFKQEFDNKCISDGYEERIGKPATGICPNCLDYKKLNHLKHCSRRCQLEYNWRKKENKLLISQ